MNPPELPDDQALPEEAEQGDLVPESEADRSDLDRTTGATGRPQFFRYRAPLPPPRDLREYEETLPGAADRILGMAEHRLVLEERKLDQEQRGGDQIHLETMTLLKSQIQLEKRGQWIGLILGLTAQGLSVYLFTQGATRSGIVAFFTALIGFIGPFVWSTIQAIRHRSHTDADPFPDLPTSPRPDRPRMESPRETEP